MPYIQGRCESAGPKANTLYRGQRRCRAMPTAERGTHQSGSLPHASYVEPTFLQGASGRGWASHSFWDCNARVRPEAHPWGQVLRFVVVDPGPCAATLIYTIDGRLERKAFGAEHGVLVLFILAGHIVGVDVVTTVAGRRRTLIRLVGRLTRSAAGATRAHAASRLARLEEARQAQGNRITPRR
eukprot:4666581-Prymnesium_polylepis.1